MGYFSHPILVKLAEIDCQVTEPAPALAWCMKSQWAYIFVGHYSLPVAFAVEGVKVLILLFLVKCHACCSSSQTCSVEEALALACKDPHIFFHYCLATITLRTVGHLNLTLYQMSGSHEYPMPCLFPYACTSSNCAMAATGLGCCQWHFLSTALGPLEAHPMVPRTAV